MPLANRTKIMGWFFHHNIRRNWPEARAKGSCILTNQQGAWWCNALHLPSEFKRCYGTIYFVIMTSDLRDRESVEGAGRGGLNAHLGP